MRKKKRQIKETENAIREWKDLDGDKPNLVEFVESKGIEVPEHYKTSS